MSKLNLEILAYEESPLGMLCLRRRELLSDPGTIVTEVTLNHEFLMSSLYTDSEEALSRIALEIHEGEDKMVVDTGSRSSGDPVPGNAMDTGGSEARSTGEGDHMSDRVTR
ncbi:MAG: hypothetical protein QGH11_13660, partial [Pirellulaceae bacterium]|nr:hypothetical protein [Pirellulaceae bacterium]